MANLLQSAVQILDSYTTDGNNGKKFSARQLILTLSTQGGTTNKILASVLSLRDLVDSSTAVASDGTIIPTVPSYDGSYLLLSGGDSTKTIKLIVKGHP